MDGRRIIAVTLTQAFKWAQVVAWRPNPPARRAWLLHTAFRIAGTPDTTTLADMLQNRTKIVATVGPASDSVAGLRKLIDAGVDLVRFNFSHGTHDDYQRTLDNLDEVRNADQIPVAALADLSGPKIRTTEVDQSHAEIAVGETCRIERHLEQGTARQLGTTHPSMVDEVEVGQRVLIDDGLIRMLVSEKYDNALVCVCTAGGHIGNHKGINLPDSELSLPPITEKDREDIAWLEGMSFDFVAMSFVRQSQDILDLRKLLRRHRLELPILAKIETPQAMHDIDGIIEVADGILVARGDLGVEMELSQIPLLQKDIIRRCRPEGRPVIVATQMLHSMVHNPAPTRAEVSDVANAVLDGTDAVMLSAESAVGQFPELAVEMLGKIAAHAREYQIEQADNPFAPGIRARSSTLHDLQVGVVRDEIKAAVTRSAALIAEDLGARLVVVWCRTGRTARWLSKYENTPPIVALTPDLGVYRRLALAYAVEPMLVSEACATGKTPFPEVAGRIISRYRLQPGDFYVVVGDPTAVGRESTLAVHRVAYPH